MRDDRLQNISGMLVFLEVVESESFSEAAQRLGLSKASVSRQIAALEQRLGAQLLRRTTRRMSLTEMGEAFRERCQRVAEEAEAAERSVSDLQAEPRGEIRVAAPMSFGHLQLAPLLPGFLARHPRVRLHLDLTDRIIDLIRERFDLALRIGSPPSETTLVQRRLYRLWFAVVATPDYLARYGTPDKPEDLVGHNCLAYIPSPEHWSFSGGRRIPTHGNLSIDNGDALRRAALLGHGIAYLPDFLVRDDLAEGRLVRLLANEVDFESGVYAVYPESRHLSPKVRALIDYLVESWGGDKNKEPRQG